MAESASGPSSDPLSAANDDVHAALEARLLEHRLEVMRRDLDAAGRTWRGFSELLQRHIDDENELVLPPWEQACAETPAERGGAPDIVAREHAKLEHHLAEIEARLHALQPTSARAAFLALLDREKILVDLLEHHDLREKNLVYPHLAPRLDPATVQRIRARFAASLTKTPLVGD